MIKVIKVISNAYCSECARYELPVVDVYECVKEKNIPVCKECGTDLTYVVNFIPTYDYPNHVREIDYKLLNKFSIRQQYFASANKPITMHEKDSREYRVN